MTFTPPTSTNENETTADVVGLDTLGATDAALVGGKASALARAGRIGVETVPGMVLTTAFCRSAAGDEDLAAHPSLAEVVDRVRSSDVDVVITMRPYFCSIIMGQTHFVTLRLPVRCTSITACHPM